MRTFIILLIVLCVTLPAMALLPSPYIGANLQINSPTGDFRKTDIVNEERGAKTGLGGELDLGITGGGGSIYAGYRFGKHNSEATYNDTLKVSGDWKINRWVIGARYHILGSTPLPIVPTLGGGVTIGKTKVSATASSPGQSVSEEETSKNSVGWFLEVGGLFKPPGPLSVIADIQYHSFDADYQSQLYNGKVKIAFFTFQVGARFSIMPL